MANEGIMAFPQGMASLGEQAPQQQQQTVTSADSYDAALTALNMTDPQQFEMFKEEITANLEGVEIPPQELETLIDILERLVDTPEDYPEFAQLAQADGIEVPDEFDPEFVGALLVVFNEMRMGVAATMQDVTGIGPTVEGLEPAQFAKGGLADVASYLQSKGRGGDRILAHITPGEAAMLQRQGGAGTINPATGLPEYGWLSKAWGKVKGAVKSVVKGIVNVVKKVVQSPIGRILGTIALATVLGPAGVGLSMGTAAGLAGAGTTLVAGGSLKEALVAGAMGYFGGGGTIMGANPVSAIGQYLPGAAGGALNTGLATGVLGAGIGKLGGMSTEDALKMGLISGTAAGGLKYMQGDGTAAAATQEAGATPSTGSSLQSPTGDIGQIGTAQDMLGTGLTPPTTSSSGLRYDPNTFSYKGDYSLTAPSTSVPSGMGGGSGLTAPQTGSSIPFNTTGAGMTPLGASGAGLQAPSYSSSDFSIAAGGTSPGTNYGLSPSPVGAPAATQPTGFVDKMIQGGKDIYNEYLSPSRPGLASDAGMFTKYGPLALAGTAGIAALGGMEGSPADQNPAFDRNYTGSDYMRDNPDRFSGGLSRYTRPETPRNPIVPTPYSTAPAGPPSAVVPTGISNRPSGVAQPYNMSGMYGVPLIYGPNGELIQAAAKGGSMDSTKFPRKNGPINGPGTGTSDEIPAMLSDGEFVFTAKAVRNAGNGSRRKGAARMYKLMKMLEGGPVKGN